MLEIIETSLNLSLPLGQHPHCLLAQIPDHLVRGDQAVRRRLGRTSSGPGSGRCSTS